MSTQPVVSTVKDVHTAYRVGRFKMSTQSIVSTVKDVHTTYRVDR